MDIVPNNSDIKDLQQMSLNMYTRPWFNYNTDI